MSSVCEWLHLQLEALRLVCFPFDVGDLPQNGIYFFYEEGECWGHGGTQRRIVRIGTHRNGNFRSRIAEHFLLDQRKMAFDSSRPAPHERSIFRKNIGRALLKRDGDDYLRVWEVDFTSKASRETFGHLRDIEKERRLEQEITRILRERFSFRFIRLERQEERMGSAGLEAPLVGTVAGCTLCKPSSSWLGNYSPLPKVKERGLWQVQHLDALPLSETELRAVAEAIAWGARR